MTDEIGIAFVGCAHPHILPRWEVLSGEPSVEFVGLYDPDPVLAKSMGKRLSIPVFDDLDDLVDRDQVRAVIIEGWEPHNPTYAKRAATKGKSVFLEKPGAVGLGEIRDLVDVLSGRPIVFQIGYQLRHAPVVAKTKELLDEDVLGPITLARFHASAPVGGAREIWQSVPENLGGVVYTDACHMIDLMLHLLGMPEDLVAKLLKLNRGPMVLAHGFKEHTLSGLGETKEMLLGDLVHEDGGAAVFNYANSLATLDVTGWEAHPWVEAWRMEFYGTDGTLHVGLQPAWYELYVRNPTARYAKGWHTWRDPESPGIGASIVADDNYRREMEHFIGRIRRRDTDNPPYLNQTENVIAVLDAVFKSARVGSPVQPDVRRNQ